MGTAKLHDHFSAVDLQATTALTSEGQIQKVSVHVEGVRIIVDASVRILDGHAWRAAARFGRVALLLHAAAALRAAAALCAELVALRLLHRAIKRGSLAGEAAIRQATLSEDALECLRARNLVDEHLRSGCGEGTREMGVVDGVHV